MTPNTVRQTIAAGSTERTDVGRAPTLVVAASASPLTFASWQEKNSLLDRAYEEYCRLRESGEAVEPEEFVRRYSRYQRSIRLMLDVHGFIESNPELHVDTVELEWPEVGDELLGFRLLEELGHGSFARVFLAAERELSDRPMAVKVAPDNIREAQTLARLKHPNIVPIYSVRSDVETGRTLICMPYLGRATLCDLLDHVSLSGVPATIQPLLRSILGQDPGTCDNQLRQPYAGSYVSYVLNLGAELADALAHTHAERICHGDLKPSNVLLAGAGRPMLLDFNLSLQMGDASRLGGTLPYIAPEQLTALVEARQGRTWDSLDDRCDLFSLGAILYELLTGKLPFGHPPANAPLRVIANELLRLRREGPLPIRHLNPRVDRRTAEIVERCLQFDPASRPASAASLARELRRAAAPAARFRAWTENHRRLVATFVAGAVVLLAATGTWLTTRPSAATIAYRQALSLYEQGEIQSALPVLRNAIELQPDFSDAYLLRARLRMGAHDYAAALEDFQRLAGHDDSGRANAGAAYSLARLQRDKDAIVEAELALNRGFRNEYLLAILANSHRLQAQWDQAIERATESIELNDRYMPAFYVRAMALETRFVRRAVGSLEQAAADIRRALELGPPSADLYFEAARIELLQSKANPRHPSAATAYLQESLRLGMPLEAIRRSPLFREIEVSPPSESPNSRTTVEILRDPLEAIPLTAR